MPTQHLALAYAMFAALPIAMHVALSLGAPLGRFTVGGRFPEHLPAIWRGLALAQAALLLVMGGTVLDRGGVLSLGLPDIAFWLTLVVTLLTTIANCISPSRAERLLWAPVTCAMSVTAIGIAFSGTTS